MKKYAYHENVSLTIHEATLFYNQAPLFECLSLSLLAGQCTCLLGPSGIGKTALLRCIAGISSEATAHITTNVEAPLNTLIDYLPQQPMLLPWLSVIDNVMIGSRVRHTQPDKNKAQTILETLGLQKQTQALPAILSGGQQQRAALARVLYEDKPVLLLDEPFSALDAITRYQLQTLAGTLFNKKTLLLVTHDPLEALRMAHDIYVMQGSPAILRKISLPQNETPRDIHTPLIQQHYTELLTQLSQAQEVSWGN